MTVANNSSASKVIRECNLILDGKVTKNQEQLNRWLVVQVKKLAQQNQARKQEHQQIQNRIKISRDERG